MNKNTAKNKTAKTAKRTAGRPRYTPRIPNGKFTFPDLMRSQGATLNKDGEWHNGKCTALCMRQFLKRDAALGAKSLVTLTDEKRAPKGGLGRAQFVFVARTQSKYAKTRKVGVKVGNKSTKAAIPSALSVAPSNPVPAPESITDVVSTAAVTAA